MFKKKEAIIDILDLKILYTINKRGGLGIPIMELTKEVNIAHTNLLNHLKKLEGFGVIKRVKNKNKKAPENRKVFIFITEKGLMFYNATRKLINEKVIDFPH